LDLNPETRRNRVSDLYDHSPGVLPTYFIGYWILRILRQEQRDPKFARAHEVRNPRVGCLPAITRFHGVPLPTRWIWNSQLSSEPP
jgi:hypothetical protein